VDGPRPDPVAVLQALHAAILENTREARGLREDLGAIYGRDDDGRLLALSAADGRAAPVPAAKWTPRDVKEVIGQLLGEPRGAKKKTPR
jgi:hypothetical protein